MRSPPPRVEYTEIGFPELTAAENAPAIPPEVYEQRIAELLRRVESDWIVVYGDREHPD